MVWFKTSAEQQGLGEVRELPFVAAYVENNIHGGGKSRATQAHSNVPRFDPASNLGPDTTMDSDPGPSTNLFAERMQRVTDTNPFSIRQAFEYKTCFVLHLHCTTARRMHRHVEPSDQVSNATTPMLGRGKVCKVW